MRMAKSASAANEECWENGELTSDCDCVLCEHSEECEIYKENNYEFDDEDDCEEY